MADRYLVLSDIHLTDVEEHDDQWKYYKSARYLCDGELAELIGTFEEESDKGDELTLVLNGDIFDFDLVTAVPDDPPWKVKPFERKRVLRPSAEKSAWKLERILSDHPRFVEALSDFMSRGHRVIYLLGNHDREFHFSEVQEVFLEALRKCREARGQPVEPMEIRFEPWFFYVPGRIYIEHGQQFDYYTSYRHICSPVVTWSGQQQLALPMGNISNRYLMTKMGYFNPHASDYILNLYSYIVHWLKYYAFTRRSLAFNWFFGSLLVLVRLLRTKKKLIAPPPDCEANTEAVRLRYGLSESQLEHLLSFHKRPITSRLFRLFREFWLDRVLISVAMVIGTVALALVPIPLWIKLMVPLTGFPLIYLIYELAAKGGSIFTVEKQIPEYARRIGKALEVPVVTFGHTHVPRLLVLDKGLTFVDTGTWAPITDDTPERNLKPGFRNYLVVEFPDGRPEVRFDCF